MLRELYDIILKVCGEMNKTFAVPFESITEDTPLKELGIDSLTFVMIMLAIEEHYGVSLVTDEDSGFKTVKDVISAVRAALGSEKD